MPRCKFGVCIKYTLVCDSRQILECCGCIWPRHLIYVTSRPKANAEEKCKKTNSCNPYRTLNKCTCDTFDLFVINTSQILDEI